MPAKVLPLIRNRRVVPWGIGPGVIAVPSGLKPIPPVSGRVSTTRVGLMNWRLPTEFGLLGAQKPITSTITSSWLVENTPNVPALDPVVGMPVAQELKEIGDDGLTVEALGADWSPGKTTT